MVAAATDYPGGYDWTRDFVSTLFASTTPQGIQNPARYFAIPAAFVLCVGVGVMSKMISVRLGSPIHATTLEIGGIGSMVYAFLAVTTPLHDLLVSLSLAFFLAALFATMHFLFTRRERVLLSAGVVCFAMLTGSAVSYYGNVYFSLLAVGQKLTFAACMGWLVALYFADLEPEKSTPNQS